MWKYSDQSRCTGSRMRSLIALAVVYILFSPIDLKATCSNVPNFGNANNLATVTTQSACAVYSGTYVAKGTTVKISGLATVDGSCDLYALNANQQCSKYKTDFNLVDHLVLWRDGVDLHWVTSWQTRPGQQTFDTNNPQTTGPFSDTPTVGTHTYSHRSYNYIAVYQNCPAT